MKAGKEFWAARDVAGVFLPLLTPNGLGISEPVGAACCGGPGRPPPETLEDT